MTISNITVLSATTQTLTFKIDGTDCLHSLDYPCNNPLDLEVDFSELTEDQLHEMIIRDLDGFFNEDYFEIFQEDYKAWKATQVEVESVKEDIFETFANILRP